MKKISIRSLCWYLKHPWLMDICCSQIFRAAAKRIKPPPQTVQWYHDRAVTFPQAAIKVTGRYQPQGSIDIRKGGCDEMLNIFADHLQAQRIIETGVCHGLSSKALLLSLSKRGGKLVSTDVPSLERWVNFGDQVPEDLKRCWQLVLRPDRRVLPALIEQMRPLDMCYYDSDKSYTGRMFAYPLLWQALRTGGIFVSDDISDNYAFRDFCQKIKRDPVIAAADKRYVGIIVK